jgi:hypothetical protein
VSLSRKPLIVLMLIALIGVSGQSMAETDYMLSDHWVPSASFAVSVHEESLEMVADNPINFAFDRSRAKTLASLRFGAEIMSPTFEDIPNKPRLFVSGGVLWSTPGNGIDTDDDDTSARNDYREVNVRQRVLNFDRREAERPGTQTDTVDSFEGQGNRIRSRRVHNAWHLGVGSVFTFPRDGFTIRVRPSIEYVGEKMSTKGQYTLLTDIAATDTTNRSFLINEIKLKGNETHHNLGPAAEIEFINHLDGNFTLSFFTQARFLFIVGDRVSKLKGTTESGGDVLYSVKRERFNFSGGAGIRLGFRNMAFTLK